jgi:hypothetical protein
MRGLYLSELKIRFDKNAGQIGSFFSVIQVFQKGKKLDSSTPFGVVGNYIFTVFPRVAPVGTPRRTSIEKLDPIQGL